MGGLTYQLLPSLTYEEYQALKEDIAARGVQVPVEIDEAGTILDGHHRVRVCEELGISEYPTNVREGWTEDQKREHVLALNLARRHLTREQQRDLERRLREDGWSYRRIAAAVRVDPMTVHHDLAGVEISTPALVTGADGKTYPASRPTTAVADAADDDQALSAAEYYDRTKFCERCRTYFDEEDYYDHLCDPGRTVAPTEQLAPLFSDEQPGKQWFCTVCQDWYPYRLGHCPSDGAHYPPGIECKECYEVMPEPEGYWTDPPTRAQLEARTAAYRAVNPNWPYPPSGPMVVDVAADAPPVNLVRMAKSHADSYAERMAAADTVNAPPDGYLDTIVRKDALSYLRGLPNGCAHMGITSPPYWAKREYAGGDPNEIGKERHPEDYVDHLCAILAELPRVLTPRGVLFLNLGDTRGSQPGQYRGDPSRRRGISNQAILANGTAPAGREHDLAADKTWCLVPESVVLRCALDYGWLVVSKIVWRKVGHGPENVYDRLTQAWEPVYVLAQHPYPWFWGALDGKRAVDVWDIPVGRQGDAAGHLAPFPDALVERAIQHACPAGGVALDFFAGSGTVLDVAQRTGRHFLGCDLMAADQ